MRKSYRIAAVLLTMILMVSLFGMTAAAEDYTYTVTVSAGSIGDNATVTQTFHKGETFSYDYSTVKVNDSKYYPKGVAIAGSQELTSPSFTVTEDVDLVVVYGVDKGGLVTYKANYLDADGNQIAASDTFYGNIGDKPIVSAKYINGYVLKNAYNITGTITGDGVGFDFIYAKETANARTDIVTRTETTVVPGTTQNGGTGNNAAGTNGTVGSAAVGTSDGNVTGSGTEAGTEADNGTVSEDKGPADIIDLDDGEVPKTDGKDGSESGNTDQKDNDKKDGAGGSDQGTDSGKGSTNFTLIGGIAAAVVAAGAAVGAVSVNSKRKRNRRRK